MRFLVDENLPIELVLLLKEHGHHAMHALERLKPGQPDSAIFKLAQRERRILITCDLDFSDIRRFPPGKHFGILILRVEPQSTPRFLHILGGFLHASSISQCARTLTILDEKGYRIRSREIPG